MSGGNSEIRLEENGSKGRYVIDGPGGAVAEMTYTNVGAHQIIIDHTEVPDAFRGQGVCAWSPAPSRTPGRPARPSFRSVLSRRRSSGDTRNGPTC